MRRLLTFTCSGETLVATLDEAAGTTGLLIVSGGNEVRAGAHRGMARLAARLSASGTPVFRFDRRGVGDSGGDNGGYASGADDIAAAAIAFRGEAPQVARLVGFGNCDAASALALFGRTAGLDAVLLANPWVIARDELPPAAAIRRRYAARLLSPADWWRLGTGQVDFVKLVKGLRRIVTPEPQDLADRVTQEIANWGEAARIVLAAGDATAIAFSAAAAARALATITEGIETASHSFAGEEAGAALEAAIRRMVQPDVHGAGPAVPNADLSGCASHPNGD